MAADELQLNRFPTPSTSLLPVVGPHRKLNGRCRWSTADDDVAETSFIAERSVGDVPACTAAACNAVAANKCVLGTSRDSVNMKQHPGSASQLLDQFYIDTKGADDSSPRHNTSSRSTCSAEAGPRKPMTSLVATETRSTYVRVAGNCSLLPQVERLRRDYVTSAPFVSDQHRIANKFV